MKKTTTATGSGTGIWKLLPLIFVMAVNPLIIRYHGFMTGMAKLSWYVTEDEASDFFNYFKSWFFVAACVLMLLLLIYQKVFTKDRLKWLPAFIPLGIYGLLALVSAMASPYSYYSFHGISDHFETVFVLLGYCVAAFYAFNVVRTEEDLKIVIKCWLAGILVLCLLGISQAAGHDLLATEFGKKMLLPSALWGSLDRLQFKMAPGRVYLTMFNPNYVGSYVGLAFPVLLAAVLCFQSWKWKTAFAAAAAGLVVCLMGAEAKNGMIALALALLVFVILMRKRLLKQWKIFAAGIVLLVIGFAGFNQARDNAFVKGIAGGLKIQEDTSAYPLEKIETADDYVAITYNGNTLYINAEINEAGNMLYYFKDQEGNQLEAENREDGASLRILDENFSEFVFTSGMLEGKTPVFNVNIDGRDWMFSNSTGYSGYYYINSRGKATKMEDARETPFLRGYESLFSGRGYIWSRTLPLLKDHILLGSGPDTFTLVFPQRDYVKAARYGYYGMHITKPHNLYLQIGVQTGVVSLLAFLAFAVWYFIGSLVTYWKNPMADLLSQMGAGICAAVAGYLVSGIINDSTVTVAPVFWCLIGIGFAVNRMVKEKEETA